MVTQIARHVYGTIFLYHGFAIVRFHVLDEMLAIDLQRFRGRSLQTDRIWMSEPTSKPIGKYD